MNVSFNIDTEDVIKALDQMDAKTYRASLRSGLRSAMQPLRKAVVAAFKGFYPESLKADLLRIRNYKRGVGVWMGLHKGKVKQEEVRAIIALRALNRGRAGYISRKGANKGNPEQGLLFWDNAVSATEGTVANLVEKKVTDAVMKKAKKEGLV
jgi:hypothetical protein